MTPWRKTVASKICGVQETVGQVALETAKPLGVVLAQQDLDRLHMELICKFVFFCFDFLFFRINSFFYFLEDLNFDILHNLTFVLVHIIF
jgi:hypothetical protein